MTRVDRAGASELAAGLRVSLWCAAAVVAEIGLYASYRGQDARFHWFTHFLVGGSISLAAMVAVARRRRRPVPNPLAWVVAGHVFAMVPDLLFVAGVAHERWMDLFAGHLTTHFVPGRNLSWYAVFLVALAAYLATLDRVRPA